MAFAKCVPHSVEGIMMGGLTSMIKFNSEILMRLLSIGVLAGYPISIEDYEGLGQGMADVLY